MELYEYTIEKNKITDKYNNLQKELSLQIKTADTLDNCKHNVKILKKQLDLAKHYRDKNFIEQLNIDINYLLAKISNEETRVYDTLFSKNR